MIYLPEHKCSLTIEHNKHRDYYKTVKECFDEVVSYSGVLPDFESEEDKQKCIDTNELWTLQWYKNTPLGFDYIGASSLEKLLEWCKIYEATA